jgi:glycosyltransferase involved in cell wall biosynthesis
MKKIAVIIPVYNEEKYLPDFLQNLIRYVKTDNSIHQIIFVNDGSIDKTQNILESAQEKFKKITVLTNKKNTGKGSALKKGLLEAKISNSDGVIFMDGDGQHDPASIPEFVRKMDDFPIVFGYRELKKNVPAIRKTGNQIAHFIIRNIFNIKREGDILCGYFAMRRDLFDKIFWYSNDYGVEAEISAIIGRKNIPFTEILVKTIYLDNNKGVNMFDALLILLHIPYWSITHVHE